MRWLPRFAINQLVSFESTLTPAERRRTVDRILADPARRAFLAQLLESASLTPLQREGFHNDMRQFRDIGVLPLREVQCPTLVVHGTHDRDVPFAHAEHSAREIPQAQLHRVAGGWHLLPLGDDPDGHTNAQIDFLRDHVTGSV